MSRSSANGVVCFRNITNSLNGLLSPKPIFTESSFPGEALDFVRFLTTRARAERFATAIASEPLLRRDWDTPEEDEAWKEL